VLERGAVEVDVKLERLELAGEVRVELLANGVERATGGRRGLVVTQIEVREPAVVSRAQQDVADGAGMQGREGHARCNVAGVADVSHSLSDIHSGRWSLR
jgi:hypothetical protein